MYQTLLSIFIPPLAICRYGSASCCIYPISGIWFGGLALFAYHFLTAHHVNPLTEQGSLYGGVILVTIAIIWTRMTLKRVESDDARARNRGNAICARLIPNPSEPDPLEEAARARRQS